ncbi:MAG: hypothetical protein IPO58_03905 [Betaproteobacteria bacterium]|nr:hypothetical protein [Betaproteobacteria bacterium]
MNRLFFERLFRSLGLLILLLLAGAALAEAGERYRVHYQGRWVDYFEQDGMAVAEGDIVLGAAADIGRLRDGQGGRKALVVDLASLLWPVGPSGAHEVPYVFEAGPQANIDAAIAQFNAAFAGIIQWVPRVAQADYVAFNLVGPTGSCFSNVGRSGGRQQIGGVPTCSIGALLHEMGHAIGFWHTQSDVAQDSFLRILYATMDPRWRSQYTPIVDSRALDGYDYASIMHYGPFVQSTTPDALTAFTIPAGIDTGLRATYSAADIDAVKRLYGGAPSAVTVTSNPPGLQVIIDGISRTTPVTLDWRLGSLHRLDVPAGLQASGNFRFAFGRWSHDAGAAPQGAQEWIVEPGQGFRGQPFTAPRSTVLVANFVRLVQVQRVVSGGAFGQLDTSAETPPWPGTTDYYPQLTRFDFLAQPDPGYLTSWLTTSYSSLSGGGGGVASASRRIGSVSPLQVGATFFPGPAIVVQTAGDGVDGTLRANITAPGASAAAVSTLIPNVLRSNAPGSYTIAADATQNRSDSVRFTLKSIAGLDDSVAGLIVMPTAAEQTKVVTLTFQKQFQPFVQRSPTCGGTVSFSPGTTWQTLGTTLTATATPVGGAVFAGWSGSIAGPAPVVSMAVDRVPELKAHFNAIPEPFTVTSLTPLTYVPGQGPVTFEFTGTGFGAGTFLSLDGGGQKFGQAIGSRTYRVTLTEADFPHDGKVVFDLGSTVYAGCDVFADSIAIEVFPKVTPQLVTVHEFYNAALDRYFRTASDAEAAAIRANPATGEQDTGQSFKAWTSTAYPAGASPVHRFYGSVTPGPNSHFFTADVNEARLLQRAELDTPAAVKRWNYEELSFAIKPAQAGGCPADAPVRIYRVYNNGFALGKDSNHRLLTDFGLYTQMVAQGWLGEGVAMCGPQ